MVTENKRLAKLSEYQILDTPSENDFDELVLLASKICNTPISLISLIDEDRQWFKANVGLEVNETPRDISFCHHAIQQNEIFVIPDATKDERFRYNPLVTGDPEIRFYAGMPLSTNDGYNLGTLCVIDRIPRILTDHQIDTLKILSKQVIKQLDLKISLEKEKIYGNLLEEKRIQLEELNRIKSKVFSIVAHDLRTPLRNVKDILMMFEDNSLGAEELQAIMPKLSKKVDLASDMLDNLLNWSQSQFKGKMPLIEKRNISAIINEKLKELQPLATEKDIIIQNNVEDHLYAFVEPEVLRIVIRNLIINAIKFSKAGDRIIVNSKENGEFVSISITDFGCGIPEENLLKLFDETDHISTYGTDNEKGIGIGLKLCKTILSNNNAQLSVMSETGKGSTFTITLKSNP